MAEVPSPIRVGGYNEDGPGCHRSLPVIPKHGAALQGEVGRSELLFGAVHVERDACFDEMNREGMTEDSCWTGRDYAGLGYWEMVW